MTIDNGPGATSAFCYALEMNIRYQETCEDITPAQLTGFFTQWRDPRTPTEHLAMLRGSAYVVLALDETDGHVVGFITALTDGVQAAFIPLLEVLPGYQGRGIGSELMRRMLGLLSKLPAIDLTCRPELQPFYTRFGLQPSVGAVVRKYR